MNYVEKKKHRIGNEKIVDCIERVEEKKKVFTMPLDRVTDQGVFD
jgi:hypothetical protein